MEKLRSVQLLLYCFVLLFPLPARAGSEFIAVAYHDIVNHRNELTFDGVTLDNLIDHFEWLKVSGYKPISIDDLKAANEGVRPLPDKAVLLCWDDAYTSFFTHVFPLLKAYNYPAVLALVGTWMSPGPEEMVQYGEHLVPRKKFMTWAQLREVASSGLVEIASHSNGLHTAVLADQAGDRLPAAIAHKFDPKTGSYETDDQFKERIREDLQASSDLIQQHLGLRPRVLVWPFGRYNASARDVAEEIGMSITLTLNPVPGDTDQLQAAGRLYPTWNPDLKTFRSYLDISIRPPVTHFFRVDSNDLLEPSETEEVKFGAFLDRVKDLDPDMVIIDPVVEVDGKLHAMFVNSRLPLAQDRLQRLTWHTHKRAGAEVFLWLSPSLFAVAEGETGETVNRFFSDMGKSAPGRGVVVDHPELVKALLEATKTDLVKETDVRFWNPDKFRWARQSMLATSNQPVVKSALNALEEFQRWQPFQEISLVLDHDQFQAMEMKQFNGLLSLFDFLVVDIDAASLATFLAPLAPQFEILQKKGYLRKCMFLLSNNDHVNLVSDLRRLQAMNGINWGYQYDYFQENLPPLKEIRQFLSKSSFPYPIRY